MESNNKLSVIGKLLTHKLKVTVQLRQFGASSIVW